MRANVLLLGILVLAVGILLLIPQGFGLFATTAGILNIILGLVTSTSAGVTTGTGQPNSPKLLVDKGVVKTSIYQLAFFDTKLVLKKLASANTTVLLALILAIVGFLFDGLLGALSGGLTGYSIQEYLTQKNRDRIARLNAFASAGRFDLEIPYDKLNEARLHGNRLQLVLQNAVMRVSLPRGYSNKMRPVIEKLLSDKLVVPGQTPEEKNQ